MCAYSYKYELATQDIIYGGKVYSVCDEHAANAIPDPRQPDFGPAPANGTETSSQSARQSGKDVTPQAYLVLGVIAAHPDGLTREEIYSKAGITNQAACARLNTLQERGLIFIEGKLNQQCFTVLGVVAAAGPQGVTREEVCQRAGVVNQAACARLNTLEQHGLVIVDGEKRMASTRRSQQVYKYRGAA